MNERIRRLGIVLMVLYAALFVRLNVIQVAEQEDLNEHPENARPIQREFNRPRGTIVSADGALLAESVEVEGATFDRQRVYPEGELFGHVTGYFSFLYGASGVEQQYNDELTGNTLEQQLEGLSDLLADEQNTGNLRLTVRKDPVPGPSSPCGAGPPSTPTCWPPSMPPPPRRPGTSTSSSPASPCRPRPTRSATSRARPSRRSLPAPACDRGR